jgi:hypothetical protein
VTRGHRALGQNPRTASASERSPSTPTWTSSRRRRARDDLITPRHLAPARSRSRLGARMATVSVKLF